MSSLSPLQRRLDSQFERAQNQLDETTLNASDGYSQADSFAFFEASMGLSSASWAATQEITVKHGLAKAIINEIN
ncbi:type III secretion protein HrpF [Pantoea agglomerans]|uniref:type III secretion protein HrpF n=1 Tax=Enterobacter agglomerans TaxID=549 RepID=UPI0007E5873F|nr:type III secretion protein HrpF [Pantoea agglomerans]WHU90654.1 type III secretion protein HrpF [Pantoea agglomerans pv. gypsophilae]